MDPFHQDKSMRKICERNGIHYQAYSSLGTQWTMRDERKIFNGNPVLRHPKLLAVAKEKEWSVARVALSWALQQNPPVSVVPRSERPEHIHDNAQLFGGPAHDGGTTGAHSVSWGVGNKWEPTVDNLLSVDQMAAIDALDNALANMKAKGFDPHKDQISLKFTNSLPEGVSLYWVDQDKKEHQVAELTGKEGGGADTVRGTESSKLLSGWCL
jgi:hypothetical protein